MRGRGTVEVVPGSRPRAAGRRDCFEGNHEGGMRRQLENGAAGQNSAIREWVSLLVSLRTEPKVMSVMQVGKYSRSLSGSSGSIAATQGGV